MQREKHHLLSEQTDQYLEDEEDERVLPQTPRPRESCLRSPTILTLVILIGFATSMVLNIVLASTMFMTSHNEPTRTGKSAYAGLEFDKISTWKMSSPYTGPNITAADQTWLDVDISHAFVALPNARSSEMGLLPSLEFPWERENKSLYLINGIHSLHCLQILHQSNLEYRTGHTQTYETEHLLHCLDNLRSDIECQADDSLRYVPVHAHVSTVATGIGQPRQCRDWSKLQDWAKEHSGCFNYHQFALSELNETNVYPSAWSFCQPESSYLPSVREFYHQGSDWLPVDPGAASKDGLQNALEYGYVEASEEKI